MQLQILHEGNRIGTAQIRREGLYWNIDAVCSVDSDRICRLWAHTGAESVRLGVLIPDGSQWRLSKKIPINTICLCEQTCITTDEIQMPHFEGTIGEYDISDAYLLEKEGDRTLCILYREQPFSLMEYICFFRLEKINGKLFWMTELDERNFPVFC